MGREPIWLQWGKKHPASTLRVGWGLGTERSHQRWRRDTRGWADRPCIGPAWHHGPGHDRNFYVACEDSMADAVGSPKAGMGSGLTHRYTAHVWFSAWLVGKAQ